MTTRVRKERNKDGKGERVEENGEKEGNIKKKRRMIKYLTANTEQRKEKGGEDEKREKRKIKKEIKTKNKETIKREVRRRRGKEI